MSYTAKEIFVNDAPCLGVTLSKYPDTVFVIGKVAFEEVDDVLKLRYNYDVVEGPTPTNKQEFETAIGDMILDYINKNTNDLIYTGGT